jgi:hypothetical protein
METNPQNPALNELFVPPTKGDGENITIPVEGTVSSNEQEKSEPVMQGKACDTPDADSAVDTPLQETAGPLPEIITQPETEEESASTKVEQPQESVGDSQPEEPRQEVVTQPETEEELVSAEIEQPQESDADSRSEEPVQEAVTQPETEEELVSAEIEHSQESLDDSQSEASAQKVVIQPETEEESVSTKVEQPQESVGDSRSEEPVQKVVRQPKTEEESVSTKVEQSQESVDDSRSEEPVREVVTQPETEEELVSAEIEQSQESVGDSRSEEPLQEVVIQPETEEESAPTKVEQPQESVDDSRSEEPVQEVVRQPEAEEESVSAEIEHSQEPLDDSQPEASAQKVVIQPETEEELVSAEVEHSQESLDDSHPEASAQKVVTQPETEKESASTKVEQPQESVDDSRSEEPLQEAGEEDTITVKYANRTRKELVVIFEQLLRATTDKAAETLRKDAELIKSVFYTLLLQEQKNAGTDTLAAKESDASNELESKFKKLYNEYKQRRAQQSQLAEQEKEENLAKKLAIIEELKLLLDKQENLTQTFPAFRALQQHWRETGSVPLARAKDIWETYQYHVERFYDYVKINNELRDLDLKKNLEAKTLLCEKAEELLLEPSVINAFVKLQRYHEQWRDIGPVARELREQVWERFKNASNVINKKHQDYFEQQREQQKKNLAAKIALCEKAEEFANTEIKNSTDWNNLTRELERLQKIWKTIRSARRRENIKLHRRFHKACDKFYAAKKESYNQFKAEVQKNMKLRLDLLEQAEALKESDDWKKAGEQFADLQKQWKEIGSIGNNQTEILWKHFRATCNYFFERRQKHFASIDLKYEDNLQRKKAIIKKIEDFVPGRNVEDNLNALKNFQRQWTEIGYVPIKEKERTQTAYRTALDKQFSALHLGTSEKKIIRFQNHIEDLQHSSSKANRMVRSERDKLVQKLRQLETDITLWENNIGFFAKSKNADALMADVDKKIAATREEITTIEAQIKLIDKQYE